MVFGSAIPGTVVAFPVLKSTIGIVSPALSAARANRPPPSGRRYVDDAIFWGAFGNCLPVAASSASDVELLLTATTTPESALHVSRGRVKSAGTSKLQPDRTVSGTAGRGFTGS